MGPALPKNPGYPSNYGGTSLPKTVIRWPLRERKTFIVLSEGYESGTSLDSRVTLEVQIPNFVWAPYWFRITLQIAVEVDPTLRYRLPKSLGR